MSLLDDLLDIERTFWGAGGDPDFYREHFAVDGRCVFGAGILDKDTVVASMEQAAPWVDVEIDRPEVIPLGDDVATLVYHATARRAADGAGYDVNVGSVYVRRDGRWQLFLHQHAPTD
ncbi:MAG: nuclear transport factor 2 family protein [Ilumatobacteraceae bacterium]